MYFIENYYLAHKTIVKIEEVDFYTVCKIIKTMISHFRFKCFFYFKNEVGERYVYVSSTVVQVAFIIEMKVVKIFLIDVVVMYPIVRQNKMEYHACPTNLLSRTIPI